MSDLRDRIADALYQHDPTSRTEGMSAHVRQLAREAADARADAVMGVVGPEIAARDAALARVRTALQAEIDDMDPDHTMRDGHTDGTDQGHPGNAWWRAYCEVGGMVRALACIDHVRSADE